MATIQLHNDLFEVIYDVKSALMAVKDASASLRLFAAQVRAARAVLNWSQRELADHLGMTQKSVYRIEKGESDIRRSTMDAFETIFDRHGISFRTDGNGGFVMSVTTTSLQGDTAAL